MEQVWRPAKPRPSIDLKKRGTYTAITLRSTRRTQIKKRDKQFFGFTKFPALTHVSAVFLP
jgi:hypothetical protein